MRNELLALALPAALFAWVWGRYLVDLAVARLRYEYRRRYA